VQEVLRWIKLISMLKKGVIFTVQKAGPPGTEEFAMEVLLKT
jgi:hypothetical protein